MTNKYKGSSQEKADKKYRQKIASDKNKRTEQNIKAQYRSTKSYIRNHATIVTLEELQKLIDERKDQINAK